MADSDHCSVQICPKLSPPNQLPKILTLLLPINLSVDLLNWKPYTVCFKYCREYAWDCFNSQLKSCHQVVLDFLFSWWPYIFFFRPFFIGSVCPRKITLLSMPVIRSFKHLLTSLYRTSSKFSGRLIRLSILFAIN